MREIKIENLFKNIEQLVKKILTNRFLLYKSLVLLAALLIFNNQKTTSGLGDGSWSPHRCEAGIAILEKSISYTKFLSRREVSHGAVEARGVEPPRLEWQFPPRKPAAPTAISIIT